jgi:hypothetical protein
MSQFHFLSAIQLARQFRWFIQQPVFWVRSIALIPEYTILPGIAAVPQSSSTADKAEFSILAPDNRYAFSVILWSRKNSFAENALGQLAHHTVLCDMPPMEANNHCAWFSFLPYP